MQKNSNCRTRCGNAPAPQRKKVDADGKETDWLKPSDLVSSGLDEAACLAQIARAERGSLPAFEGAVASLPSEATRAVSAVRVRVAQDKLPLLSLLQVEPLKMQSSHLSFQEYYAARAILSLIHI